MLNGLKTTANVCQKQEAPEDILQSKVGEEVCGKKTGNDDLAEWLHTITR